MGEEEKGGGEEERDGEELGLCKHPAAFVATCVEIPWAAGVHQLPWRHQRAETGTERFERCLPGLALRSVCVWKWNREVRAKPVGGHRSPIFLWATSLMIDSLLKYENSTLA